MAKHGRRTRKPSGTACASYTSKSVNDNLYVCANGINEGKYAYNNLQQYDATWYHKNFQSQWHMATESWYIVRARCPGRWAERLCRRRARMRRTAWPANNGVRLPDMRGGRTFCSGSFLVMTSCRFAATISTTKKASAQVSGRRPSLPEDTFMWCHWIGTTVRLRPELRFEHAWDQKAYDNGRRSRPADRRERFDFSFLIGVGLKGVERPFGWRSTPDKTEILRYALKNGFASG